ncbi:RND family efflux transporter, MFP subunit [Pseudomonas sp. 8Z]|uniref:efflux RND transporter periplasmic adaptor subunit n=1 Tax=Pseudomonas sp. 8Z TaxID=2653166 RepID=UPI0012F0C61A|nr:efflux RND transporter periplasmic adaptor subunit [Pseudomonas sp. 8Z]VXC73092.1 RND family efflux transporter, MFP subunit [Pseudomonas sp. 8Z]
MRRLAFGLVLLCVLLAACREPTPAVQVERPVMFDEIATAQRPVTARFTGTVQPRHQLLVASRQNGHLLSRQVEVGQQVRSGQLLARLENADQHGEVDSRRGEFARAEVLWRNARDELARYQGLHQQGVGSVAVLEQLASEVKVRAATLSQARIALQLAEEHLQQTQVTADFEGVVTAWHAEVGQVLTIGSPVLSLARLDSLEVWVDLPVQGLGELLAQGEPRRIWVTSMGDGAARSLAHVRQIDPQLDVGTRVQRVRLAVERLPADVHLGSLVNVELSRSHAAPEPLVPVAAVWAQAGQHYVWKIDKQSSQVQAVEVEVLKRSGAHARVRGALQAGDRIVSAGVTRLREGQQVRLEGQGGS